MKYEVLVEVRLRSGIADPQGATIERALPALGFEGVDDVHVGKAFRLSIEAPDEAAAHARGTEMAQRLLANPVIEDSTVTVIGTVESMSSAPPVTSSAVSTGNATSTGNAVSTGNGAG